MRREQWVEIGSSREFPQDPERSQQDESIRIDRRDRYDRYTLRDSELESIRIVGAFRVIDARYLPEKALDHAQRQGLVTVKRWWPDAREPEVALASLTREGAGLALSFQPRNRPQRYYWGVVRQRELRHDLELYPTFREEAKRIEREGGQVRRVILDDEFKSRYFSEMNKPGTESKSSRRARLSRELNLPVQNGKIHMPDARVEYVDAHGQERHVDLEVETQSYSRSQRVANQAAGFARRSVGGIRAAGRSGGVPVRDGPDLKLFG